ncbi:receptor-like protein kinase, partial [Trifolium pratense]
MNEVIDMLEGDEVPQHLPPDPESLLTWQRISNEITLIARFEGDDKFLVQWITVGKFPYPCPYALEHPCGIIFNTPFGDGCLNPRFEVTCENNKSVIYFNYGEHQAGAIIVSNPSSSSFRYILTGVSPDNNCPVINSFSLPYENVSFFTYDDRKYMMVMRCEKPVDYGDENVCWDISSENCGGEEKQYYSYVVMNTDFVEDRFFHSEFVVGNIEESCRIEMKLMVSKWDEKVKCNRKCGYPEEVHSEYVHGIELRWRPILCGQQQQDRDSDQEGKRKQRLSLLCILYKTAFTYLDILTMLLPWIAGKFVLGTPFVVVVLI